MNNYKKIINIHVILGVLCALPILLTIVTGIFLSLRSYFPFMQPSSSYFSPMDFNEMPAPKDLLPNLVASSNVNTIIYKPDKGIVQLRTKDNYEYFISAKNKKIVAQGAKRTPLFIQLHEGTFFGKYARELIFLPAAIFLFMTIFTGLFMSYFWYKRKITKKLYFINSSKVTYDN